MLQHIRQIAVTQWAHWILVAVAVILYGGWSVYAVTRNKGTDYYVYYMAAYGFAHGYDVYENAPGLWEQLANQTGVQDYAPPYRYPPLTALVNWPLTFLPPRIAALLWLLSTTGALITAAWLLGRISSSAYGVTLSLVLCLGFVPALATLNAGQVNGFVLLGLVIGLYGLLRDQPIWSGIGIAVSTLLKLVPIAHLGYLGWRRLWRTLAAGVLALMTLMLVSLPLIGWQGLLSYARNFFKLGDSDALIPAGPNQSINGFWSRTLLAVDPTQNLTHLIWIASIALLIGATIALCRPAAKTTRLIKLEFALVTIAVNLVTPYAWYHQLTLLLIPLFVLVDQAFSVKALHWLLIPLAVGYVITDIHGLFWHSLEPYPTLLSMPFYTAVFMWAVLAWLIIREKRAMVKVISLPT